MVKNLQHADPRFARAAEARFQAAKALQRSGHPEQAVRIYKKLVQAFLRRGLNPSNLYASLGYTQLNDSRFADCEESLHLSLKYNQDQQEAHINLAALYQLTGRPEACEAECQRALASDPTNVTVLCTLGTLRRHQRRLAEAVQSYLLALSVEKHNGEALKGLAGAYLLLGESALSVALYRRLLTLDPSFWEMRTHLLFALQYDPAITNEQMLTEHKEYGATLRRTVGPPRVAFVRKPSLDRPLRVGYLSSNFNKHAVMCFAEASILGHDPNRATVCCISNTREMDAVTRRLKEHADAWVDICSKSDEDAVRLIDAQQLDVVVDLIGHTTGTRLPLLAKRLAPVQVAWCGYANTTGLDVMDYILTDRITTPPRSPQYFTEEPFRLPHSLLSYTPPANAPAIGPLPADANGYVTFGCLNNPSKINERVAIAWARLLSAIPGSRLLLRYGLYRDPAVAERVARLLREAGAPPDRYQILAGGADFLDTYNSIDLALDTFPYNGTTTTCEALWMGVPVVTFYGKRFAGRVGASLLTNGGLKGMVADDPAGYVQRAAELAAEPDLLRSFRSGLRTHLTQTPIFNQALFTRALEDAYLQMFRRWELSHEQPGQGTAIYSNSYTDSRSSGKETWPAETSGRC